MAEQIIRVPSINQFVSKPADQSEAPIQLVSLAKARPVRRSAAHPPTAAYMEAQHDLSHLTA